jgi:hypothetical protein
LRNSRNWRRRLVGHWAPFKLLAARRAITYASNDRQWDAAALLGA